MCKAVRIILACREMRLRLIDGYSALRDKDCMLLIYSASRVENGSKLRLETLDLPGLRMQTVNHVKDE